MQLPSAVVAQGKRADELLQAHAAARNGNTEQPAPAQETASPTPTPAVSQEPSKEQATPATATPTPAAAPDSEHKLRVLQGKYNAEVPRLAAAVKAEQEARVRAEKEAEELRKKLAAAPLVTPEEVKEFGEPLVEMTRKVAREETRPVIEENEKLKGEVKDLRAQVESTQKVGSSLNTQAFYSALDAKVPNWRVTNDTPEFLKWLDEVDPLSGRARQEILDDAQNALDASRVAAFFSSYEASVQSRAAPRTEALNDQVVPSTTRTEPPAPQKNQKIWTPASITKFYDDLRRGRYTAEEAGRIERDIDAASREGRYRQR